MMAAILASRILGLVRNMVIAHRFGQKFEADVYTGAFMIPDLLFFLIAGGALSSAFIPVFTEKLEHGEEKEAWRLFSTVACVMFVVVSGFVLIGEAFATPLVLLMNPGYSQIPAKVEATVPLTRIVLPAQLCFFLGGLMMGTQYARRKFLIPALGPVIYNLGIIFGGLVLAHWTGVAGLCWGALLGAVVGNFGLQLWSLIRDGMQFKISFDWRNPDVVKVWKLMLPVIFGLALPQVSLLFNRMFASNLGNGPQAALVNANQLMQVPLGLFAQAMGIAIFPVLSAQAARKQYEEMRATSSMGIRSMLFLSIPSSLFMMVLATPIVQLLLQQGQFHADDTALTVPALVFYSIGVFAWAAQSILSRSFYAMQDTKTPVIIGTVITLIFIPMNYLFIAPPLNMGIRGLALATSIAAILHMFTMLAVLRKRMDGIEGARIAGSGIKTLLAAVIAAAASWAAAQIPGHFMNHGVKLLALAQILLGFAAGTAVFIGCAAILKIEELKQAVSLFRRKKTPAEPPAPQIV